MMEKVSKNNLTKSDLTKVGLTSIVFQTCFNFERMQAGSFVFCITPGLKKIYKDDKEELGEAMLNNMDFINTEPHVASFLMGLVLSLEEAGEDRQLIKNLKNSLFGPLAGLGDAIFWFTLLPISAAICVSLNKQGLILGPILFIAFWALLAISRVLFVKWGYNLGVNAVDFLGENANSVTKAAGILGVMVVGGLIPNYVEFSFKEGLQIFGAVEVQAIFDSIIPNLLPMALVFGLYYLLKKKNVNIILLIVGLIVLSIGLSALGWL